MINVRLTNCTECANIPAMIDDIDCKLAKMAGSLYNNITLMLDECVPEDAISDLLHYKRILQYKSVNYRYACDFTIGMIASRVKLLKFKK